MQAVRKTREHEVPHHLIRADQRRFGLSGRGIQPKALGMKFESDERICQTVNGQSPQLWESSWVASEALKKEMDVKKIVTSDVGEAEEVVQPEEVELFRQSAWAY